MFLFLFSQPIIYVAPPVEVTPIVQEIEDEPPLYLSSCILYARHRGVDIPPNTNAWDLTPNINRPLVGGLVLLQYDVAHVAVITSIAPSLRVCEANFEPNEETCRVIEWDDSAIRGYYFPL